MFCNTFSFFGSWLGFKAQQESDTEGSGPSEIIDGFLYLSDISFIQSATLARHGITAVCSVTPRDTLTPLESTILRLALPVNDNSGSAINSHFTVSHEFIEAARKENKKVVVHCEVGMSRSPTIVISYLMHHHGMSLREAYRHVKLRRSIIQPNMGFIKQLMQYEKSIFGTVDNLFLAEYVKESYRLEHSAEYILKALESHNMDINAAMLSLFPA